MKLIKVKSWINTKCCECGKLIWPDKYAYILKPAKAKDSLKHFSGHIKICEKCRKKYFKDLKVEDKTGNG